MRSGMDTNTHTLRHTHSNCNIYLCQFVCICAPVSINFFHSSAMNTLCFHAFLGLCGFVCSRVCLTLPRVTRSNEFQQVFSALCRTVLDYLPLIPRFPVTTFSPGKQPYNPQHWPHRTGGCPVPNGHPGSPLPRWRESMRRLNLGWISLCGVGYAE